MSDSELGEEVEEPVEEFEHDEMNAWRHGWTRRQRIGRGLCYKVTVEELTKEW